MQSNEILRTTRGLIATASEMNREYLPSVFRKWRLRVNIIYALKRRKYLAAYEYALEAFHADTRDDLSLKLIKNLSQWVGDWPTHWRAVTLSDKRLYNRFANRLSVWKGEQLGNKRRLLIWRSNRDLGAELRFASMLANLNDLAPFCRVEVDERLLPLYKRRFQNIEFQPTGANCLDDCAFHASWEVLGQYLMPSFSEMPSGPWLKADGSEISAFKQRILSRKQGPIVGISWYSTNTNKNIPPVEAWIPVLQVSGINFVSVQYGIEPGNITEWGQLVSTIGTVDIDLYDDLDSVGALLSACDLVITISNSIAHQSGALGVPTWVVVYEELKLTWPLGQATTDCYPHTHLYWAQSDAEWNLVMQKLAEKLQHFKNSFRQGS